MGALRTTTEGQVVGAWRDSTRWGPYVLVRQIGSGGMGCVYEAQDTVLGHRVAVKLLHPHVAARPHAAERFLREGRAAARIRHPHVVQVFGLGTEAGTPYLAMELLERDTLATFIEREGPLALEAALDIVIPVAAAVAAAHDAGVVHRDIKPSNVCFTRRGARLCPKVVDFGVSKVIAGEGAADTTATDGMIGTAAYVAPEQARSAGRASFLSDQYSLGVVLYQCVTGAVPYSGASVYEVLEAVMTAPLVAPGARVPGVPPAFDEVLVRALSRAPAGRFPSVREFAAALLPLASEATRSAFAGELCAASSLEAGSLGVRPVGPSGDESSTVCETVPTTCEPRRATRSRLDQALWVGLAAMATFGLVARGVVSHKSHPAVVRASSDAPVLAQEALAESAVTVGSLEVSSGAPSETMGRMLPPSKSAAPIPVRPRAGAKGLQRPRRIAEPAPAGAASWTVGDNGSPVLPL